MTEAMAIAQALELVGELVLDGGAAGVLAFDRELRISYWSPAMEQAWGPLVADALGRPVLEVLPFLAGDQQERNLRLALDGKSIWIRDRQFMLPASQREVQYDAFYAPLRGGGEIIGGVAVIRDTTAQTEAAQETEHRFRNMADASPVLLWMSRPDGMCTFFNQTWLDFTGRTLEEEWGVGWAAGVHFEDLQRCLDTYTDAFNSRRVFEMEYRLRRADGTYRWILDRGTPRYTPNGTFAGFIGSCVDITDRREMELELRRAMAVKDDFLAMVSHELRTPLTVLHLALERLRGEGGGPTTTQQPHIARLQRASDRLTEMVESVLQFSRVERGVLRVNPKPIELPALVETMVDEIGPTAARKGLELTCVVDDALPPVTTDPDLIRLIVVNLLTNAIKFTDAGSVTIQLGYGVEGHRIAVTDTGPGIPEQFHARIFQPFEQLERSTNKHKPGVGLGLALVKSMAAALGGAIAIDSGVGRGSTFTITLPPGA